MNKKILLILSLSFMLFGCDNEKQQEKALLNDVIKIHDKIMADDEAIMKNKAQLDTLAVHTQAQDVKDSVAHYKALLNTADDAMMNWMNKFNPDYTGKSHTEVVDYFNEQKKQVLKVDSQLNTAIILSGNYIKSKRK